MHYEEQGAGTPVLFIHGLGSSSQDWFAQVPAFAKRHRVITCDLRGHGQSEKPAGPYSIAQYANDVSDLLAQLDAAPAHIVGISMGGMVAYQLGVCHPGIVRSLTIVNSMPEVRLSTWRDKWFYWTRRLASELLGLRATGYLIARRLFVKPEHEHLRRQFTERWARNDKTAYLAAMHSFIGWSVRDQLSSVRCPVLVLAAEEDYTPVEKQQRFAGMMPHAEFKMIPDSRHAVPVEHPDTFNECVLDFIGSVDRQEHRPPVRAENPAARRASDPHVK